MKHGLRVVFRTDASEAIGIGHFMRCLTLANALQKYGAKIRFVCRQLPEYLQDMLAQNNHEMKLLKNSTNVSQIDELAHSHFLGVSQQQDASETLEAISDHIWDWVIVDHYALDKRYESALRRSVSSILVIDDIADRVHDCDLLLDQNLYSDMVCRYIGKVPDHCRPLLGPGYALLREQFQVLRQLTIPRDGQVSRILVFLGGFDPYNCTGTAIQAIDSLNDNHFHVDVVIGKEHPYRKDVEEFCQHPQYECYIQTTRMAELMATADLAIGAGGSASWERCCLGLPAIVIAFADNQREVSKTLNEKGACLFLGNQEDVTQQNIASVLRVFIDDPAKLSEMSSQAYSLADGEGCSRMCEIITEGLYSKLQVRNVSENDEKLLLEWANDPETRRNGFSQEEISSARHRDWFRQRLQDSKGCRFYIVESSDGKAIGQVRFQREDDCWEVHYSVAPQFRARGLGRLLLGTSLEKFSSEHPGSTVILGRVRNNNVPSKRIFESLGFATLSNANGEIVVYRRYLKNDIEVLCT